ncbi:mitochondrial carrier [Ramicandelaber brevisporus]|nr:mitochondrial carrier [Ramicandelaber brevisporus]
MNHGADQTCGSDSAAAEQPTRRQYSAGSPAEDPFPLAAMRDQDVQQHHQPADSPTKAFIAGAVGGICLVLVGHPWDLIKVRLQTAQSQSSPPATSRGAPGFSEPQPFDYHQQHHQQQKSTATSSQSWWKRVWRQPRDPRELTTLRIFRQIIRTDGVRGLWRGVLPPLIGVVPIMAISFWAYDLSLRIVHTARDPKALIHPTGSGNNDGNSDDASNNNGPVRLKSSLIANSSSHFIQTNGASAAEPAEPPKPSVVEPTHIDDIKKSLSFAEIALAGALSEIPAVGLLGPAERIKIIMQTHGVVPPTISTGIASTSTAVPGPITILRAIYKEGGLRSVFRGTMATMLRDFPGGAVYFATYETVKKILIPHDNSSSGGGHGHSTGAAAGSAGAILLAGGIAGVVDWTITLPIDTLKSRLQTAPEGKYNGIRDVFRELVRNEGYTALWRGLLPVVLKALPSNAACFGGMEATRALLDKIW